MIIKFKNKLKSGAKILVLGLILIILVGLFVPTLTVAQTTSNANDVGIAVDGIGNLICRVHKILNIIIPVLMTLGVIYFIWGVAQYVIADGDESKKKGRDQIIYGIIGLAVIVGVWGLVNIVVKTFGLSGEAPSLISLTVNGTSTTCSLAGNPKFQDLLCYITRIINDSVIPLIFTLAVVMFVWGVVQFVINSDEEAKKEKGKQFMLWGIIALTVMVSVWGLVGILGSTFGINTGFIPQVKP
ncbi:hypothetical protein EXS45_01890 [Candidatus Nomurabacteria bacterium]|nr:hypothetical protein [Candidatus Nomurabacteria bacterium]